MEETYADMSIPQSDLLYNPSLVAPRGATFTPLSGMGALSNTPLPNFAGAPQAPPSPGEAGPPGSGLKLLIPRSVAACLDAPALDAVHCGLDTVVWHWRADGPTLAQIRARFELFAGDDECVNAEVPPCQVNHAGRQYQLQVRTAPGLRFDVPRLDNYPVMVYSDPVFSLSCPAED